MKIKLIKNNADYDIALKNIESLMYAQPDTPESDELDLLSTLIELYENEHFPVDLPDPIEAIKFRMEQEMLTPSDLIRSIGSKSKVSEVLNRKRPLSLRMIRSLHREFGIPAEVLLQEPDAQLSDPPMIDPDNYNISLMWKRGWFPDYKLVKDVKEHAEELLNKLFKVFQSYNGVPQVLNKQHIRCKSKMDHYALLAWQARVLNKALENNLKPFSPGIITKDFLRNVAQMSFFNDGPKFAVEFLHKNGIHFIIEPHLPKTFLDGAAMFLTKFNAPVIALTLRYDRLDSFWFCLLHELSHLSLHFQDQLETCFLDDFESDASEEIESEADKMAEDALIPPDKWDYNMSIGRCSNNDVHEFAASIGISPSIVAGRIQKATGNYRRFSKSIGAGKLRRMFNVDSYSHVKE